VRRHQFKLLVGAMTVVACSAAAGAIFGARSITDDETDIVLRASRIVSQLQTWLPQERRPEDLVYDGIGGMLDVLDPHSNYLDPRSYSKMRTRQEGSFFGVGIIISRRNGKVTVIAPVAATPAARVGLRAGDVIAAVGTQSTEDLTLDEVVDLVRGPEGSTVHLTIRRPGMEKPFDVEITRTRIPQNSVRFAFMLSGDIGYIRLSEFTNTSVREVKDAIHRLRGEGMQKLVFDLRNNPGGPLEAAVGVADTFLREGQLIVSIRGRTPDNNSTFTAPGLGERFTGPLVVLVNEGSASASEIVSGAVQDHDRGLVVGETTWGKGLVQTVFTVRDTGLALTTARYYTPSGRCIQRDYDSFIDYMTHRNGVHPDDPGAATYETDGGRTVLGGGGIAPDLEITARTLSEPVVKLYGEAAFFRFAIHLLQGVPEKDQAAFATALEEDDGVLDQFWRFVADSDIATDDDVAAVRADPVATSDVRRAIEIEVLNSTVGLEAGYRVALQADEQLEAALDNFDVAEGMLETYNREAQAPAKATASSGSPPRGRSQARR